MAFKPGKDQQFYLIPKHSKAQNMALGVTNGALGLPLELKEFNANDPGQIFKFDKGDTFFWIILPHFGDRYLNVTGAKTGDGERVVSWHWEPYAPHTMFEFVPAGDGYYRIMALHSRKYLDVYGKATGKDSPVVQHSLMTTDNQLFMPVAVTDQPINKSPVSFVEANQQVRSGVLTVVGATPEVGSALKFVVGAFWEEENKLSALWDQMKAYVDVRMAEFIMKERLKNLREKLEGIMDLTHLLYKSKDDNRGAELTSLIGYIVAQEPHYKNQKQEVLPYLVGLGTLKISMSYAKYHDYEMYYGKKPNDGQAAQNKEYLEAAINAYTKEVTEARAAILALRLKKIQRLVSSNLGSEQTLIWEGNDTKDREIAYAEENKLTKPENDPIEAKEQEILQSAITVSTATDSYDGWNQRDTNDARSTFAAKQRKQQIEIQYDAELEELLLASKFWKYFKPGPNVAPYSPVVKQQAIGIYGGKDGDKAFSQVAGKAITEIKFYSSDYRHSNNSRVLSGIEVFYNHASQGIYGKKGPHETNITIAADERISSVYGYAYDQIEGLWFATSKGVLAGGGSNSGTSNWGNFHTLFFTADLPDSFNAKLTGISGAYNNDCVQQLTFHWEYLY